MSDALLKPCAEWSALLAANPEHLTPDERRALAGHLATCRACQGAQADYALQDAFLQRQPAPLKGLPPKLLAAWAAEDGRAAVPGAAVPPLGVAGATSGPARRPGEFTGKMPVVQVRSVYSALSGLAAVLVVALLVGALVVSHLPATSRPTAQKTPIPGTATPTEQAAMPTATPGPDGTWVAPPGLAHLKSEPLIAPSNPKIIYQAISTDGQTTPPTISRSDDGGATWQSLAAPFASAQLFGMTLAVSPLDAEVLVLQVAYYASVNMPTTCPDQSVASGLRAARAGFSLCYLHYLSRDGGRHWRALALPVSSQDAVNTVLMPLGNLTASGGLLLRAQGTRLYAFMGTPGGEHLLVSADGGLTWRVADAGIGAAGRFICSAQVLPAPDGAVIFALAFTMPCGTGGTQELWRSDDAGATWHQAGPLPMPGYLNVQSFVVSSQGSQARPLVYVFIPTGLGGPGNLKVSSDGGATWQSAPDAGIQASPSTFIGPLATLSDGSVLAGLQTPVNTSPYLATALYRWKPGEAAWHQVSPAVTGTPVYVLVTGQPETIWMVVSDQAGGFLAQRLDLPT